jgi:hypothetical protein
MVSPRTLLHDAIFVNKSSEHVDSMLVHILDIGHDAWNSDIASEWSKSLDPLFDTQINYGNGFSYLFTNRLSSLLNCNKMQLLSAQNPKFALVIIHMHDFAKDGGALGAMLKTLPVKLAETTIFFIQSCYSGQYHEKWSTSESNIHLVTSAGAQEPSNGYDFDEISKLKNYFGEQPSLLGLLRFLAENYTRSTPHFSGELEGKIFKGVAVKEALKSTAPVLTDIVTTAEIMGEASDNFKTSSTKPKIEQQTLEIWNMLDIINPELGNFVPQEIVEIVLSGDEGTDPIGTTSEFGS